MSEQTQPQEQTPGWGDDISDDRRAELDRRLQAWTAEGEGGRDGPFQGVSLTGADVFYLAARALAGPDGQVQLKEALERLRRAQRDAVLRVTLDLSGLDLSGAVLPRATLERAALTGATLTGANLIGATLTGAILSRATLTKANLDSATLTSADLGEATLTDAILRYATLTRADLGEATLTSADLYRATLTSADLHEATLTGANLRRAKLQRTILVSSHMDTATELTRVSLDSHTQLGDIVWNGAPLTRVDWSQAPRLGDEDAIATGETRAKRIKILRDAARAYRGLATALRSQSMAREASHYRLREQRLEQRAMRLQRRYGAWLLSTIFDLVSGYGEEPGRILAFYAVVVLTFTAVFFSVTNFGGSVLVSHTSALKWYEALVLSLSSFHGRGFFPQMISLGDPIAMVAAVEAVLGLFTELILIATISKRFLSS
jgi:uncharacterized protein YjbI with pentapeptide repeats